MKKLLLFLISAMTCFSVSSQSFWNQQTSNTTNHLRSVYFLNSDTGYIAGNGGVILKTTDGGSNWISKTSGTTEDLYSVYFVNNDTGYVAGRFETMLMTTDGGDSWTLKNVGINNYSIHLESVFFTTNQVGYAIGNKYGGGTLYGYIIQTIDGGENWTILSSGTSHLSSVYFPSVDTGYVVGNSGAWYKTTDGGYNWVLQTQIEVQFGEQPDLESVYFLDNNLGYVAGCSYPGSYKYVIAKTTDGGSNWSIKTISGSSSAYNLYSVFFPSQDTGYVVGAGYNQGKVMKSYNDGGDWSTQETDVNTALISTFFTDNNTGYAVGTGGVILKTTNGGCNISVPGTPTGIDTLCENSANTIYTTSGASNSTNYSWSLTPNITAGQFVGGSPPLSATVDWNNTYNGTATITVKGYSDYCYGPISDPITVTIIESSPLQASTPTGQNSLCENNPNTSYNTIGATYATSYIWEIYPDTAAAIINNGENAELNWNNNFVGTAYLKVKGINICGEGQFSDSLEIAINQLPSVSLGNDTVVCGNMTLKTTGNYTSYNWNSGLSSNDSIIVSTTGDYYVFVTDLNGCSNYSDTVNITANPEYFYSSSDSICDGDSLLWHDNYLKTTGVYFDSLFSINGCDSIYELNLTVNPIYFTSEYDTICTGDSILWQGSYYDTTGQYFANYQTINSCDSIFELSLIVKPTYYYVEQDTICNGDSILWQGNYYDTAGQYFTNYQSLFACDSVYELNLLVNPVYSNVLYDTICAGDSLLWQGNFYSQAGQYFEDYETVYSCDSIYELNLSVITVDTSITQNGTTLTANAINSVYQWLTCDLFDSIPGETSQDFTATANGSYAVIINQNGCIDTSSCYTITTVGITDHLGSNDNITIFPNPTKGLVFITGIDINGIKVLNINGQVINELDKNNSGNYEVNLSARSKGLYLIKIYTNDEIINKKIVIE